MSPSLRPQLLSDATGLRDPALGSSANFLAWNGDPRYMGTGAVTVAGTLYVMSLWIDEPMTVSNLWACVSNAGSTLTAGQNLISLYGPTGAKLADGPDQTTVWNSTGSRPAAITPQTFTAPTLVYVTLLSNGTTPAAFSHISQNPVASNSNLSGATMLFATNGTSLTASPASLTLSSNSATNAQGYWVAIS